MQSDGELLIGVCHKWVAFTVSFDWSDVIYPA